MTALDWTTARVVRDAEAADAEASDDGCPVCDWRDHHYHRTNHFTGTTVPWMCDGRFRDCDDEGPTDDGQFTFTRCYIPSAEDDRDEVFCPVCWLIHPEGECDR